MPGVFGGVGAPWDLGLRSLSWAAFMSAKSAALAASKNSLELSVVAGVVAARAGGARFGGAGPGSPGGRSVCGPFGVAGADVVGLDAVAGVPP